MLSYRSLWLIFLLTASGCARWVTTAKGPSSLPRARLAPDAVVFDVAFAKLPALDAESYDAIFSATDEQPLAAELRRELAANGLRAGLLGQELPMKLRELLEAKPDLLAEQGEDVSASDLEITGVKRHLPVRAGRRCEIRASKEFPSLALLLNEEGTVRGEQLARAQCQFALKPYPQGDGRVRLELTPEITHGEEKTQWVGNQGSWMLHAGRERLVLDRLRLEPVLAPGQWLIVSTTKEIKGLGGSYFVETAGSVAERRFMLIRLSQTQFDDLFAPEQTSAALATPGE
jgi:hypothetical protein